MRIRHFYLLSIACLAAVLLLVAGGIALAVWVPVTAAVSHPLDDPMHIQVTDAPTIVGAAPSTVYLPPVSTPTNLYPPTVIPLSITTHLADQVEPHIDGNIAIWRDLRNGTWLDIYGYDFTVQQEFTLITYTTVFTNWVPILDISDRFAVWSHPASDAEGIWGYDLRADTDDDGIPNYRDSDRPYPDPAACRITEMGKAPAISGDLMVYQTFAFRVQWNIGLIDLDADGNGILDCRQEGYVPNAGYQLTDNGPWENKSNMFPDIWDSIVVWEHWDEATCNIHAYDLRIDSDENGIRDWKDPDRTWPNPAQCEVTRDDGGHTNPAIFGNIVVWVDWRNNVPGGSKRDIFGYDLSEDSDGDGTPNCWDSDRPDPDPDPAEFRLTTDPNNQWDPAISAKYVVWTDARKASLDIYGYDLTVDSDDDGTLNYRELVSARPCPDPAEFRITTSLADQDSPAISDDQVVWRDNRNGNGDIYGAQLAPACGSFNLYLPLVIK